MKKKLQIILLGYNSMCNIERCIDSVYAQTLDKDDYDVYLFLNFSDTTAYNNVALWQNRTKNHEDYNKFNLILNYLDLENYIDNEDTSLEDIMATPYIDYLKEFVYPVINSRKYDYTLFFNTDASLSNADFLEQCVLTLDNSSVDTIDISNCYKFSDTKYNPKPKNMDNIYVLGNILSNHFYKTKIVKKLWDDMFDIIDAIEENNGRDAEVVVQILKEFVKYHLNLNKIKFEDNQFLILYTINQFNIINLLFKWSLAWYIEDSHTDETDENKLALINNLFTSLFEYNENEETYMTIRETFFICLYNFLLHKQEYYKSLAYLEDNYFIWRILGEHDNYCYECLLTYNDEKDDLIFKTLYINLNFDMSKVNQ